SLRERFFRVLKRRASSGSFAGWPSSSAPAPPGSVEAVCGASGELDAWDGLASLVGQSLLRHEVPESGTEGERRDRASWERARTGGRERRRRGMARRRRSPHTAKEVIQ